jgi:hypothetical protein
MAQVPSLASFKKRTLSMPAWSRTRRFLRSALARFRKPAAAPEPRRRVTTAEAWDLWRVACCEERGGHAWKMPDQFRREDGREYLAFTCRHCPVTMDTYVADDEIRLPWGGPFPVVTWACKYCGTAFRWVQYGSPAREYCSYRHAGLARAKKIRDQQRSLAACAEKGKLRYEDERTAARAAGRYELRFGGRRYPYECPCGSWHLTTEPPDAREKADALKRILFGELAR